MDFKDTELTLGLPGGSDGRSSGAVVLLGGSFKSSMKRGFMETVDLEVENSNSEPRGQVVDAEKLEAKYSSSSSTSSSAVKPPAAKTRVVGWPPVRLWRKKVLEGCKSKYVKVGADGAPYLRKVDLEMYNSYEELLRALEQMFTNTSFTITIVKHMEDRSKLMKPAVKGMEYAATYEDKDGDWMLVGDVPWKMFTESCKRIRLMKSSEAVGIAPRSSFSQCTSTN